MKEFEGRISELVDAQGIKNCTVAVFNKDEVLFLYQKKNNGTSFPWGCVTKLFSDYALRLICDEKNIRLQTPISDLIPFKNKDPFIEKNLSIFDCLCHRVKIPYDEIYCGIIIKEKYSLSKILKHLFSADLSEEFRNKSYYNDINYLLIGAVIETLAETSYTEHISCVLRQVGMNSTDFVDYVPMICDGFVDSKTVQLEMNTLLLPAMGLIGNICDKITFGRLFLAKEKTVATDILSQKILYMDKKYNREISINGNAGAWGFRIEKGLLRFNHKGYFPGWSSKLEIIPELNMGVYIEIDQHQSYIPAIIMDMYTEYYEKRVSSHNTKQILRKNERSKMANKMYSLLRSDSLVEDLFIMFSNAMGSYYNEVLGEIIIFSKQNTFYINLKGIYYEIMFEKGCAYFYLVQYSSYINIRIMNRESVTLINVIRGTEYVYKKS